MDWRWPFLLLVLLAVCQSDSDGPLPIDVRMAMVLGGELRFRDEQHFEEFRIFAQPFEVYVSTYTEYAPLCRRLTSKCALVGRTEPRVYQPKGNMYQWWHLNEALTTFAADLATATHILRFRTDVEPSDELPFMVQMADAGILYADTDRVFFAQTSHFVATFAEYYDAVRHKYWQHDTTYFPIRYDHVLLSDLSAVRFTWLVLPQFLLDDGREQPNIKTYISANLDRLERINAGLENATTSNGDGAAGFASERYFALRAISSGPVHGIPPLEVMHWDAKKDAAVCCDVAVQQGCSVCDDGTTSLR